MHYWRLLILALLAAFQPIASFTERSLVDGRQECCDRQTYPLLRGSRQLYGSPRHSTTPEDRRLDHQDQTHEERRYELKNSVLTRAPSGRLSDYIEHDTRRFPERQVRREQLSRVTEERNRNIFGKTDKRNRMLRENDALVKFPRESREVTRYARDENERNIRKSPEGLLMDEREERTTSQMRSVNQREIRDEVRSNIVNHNDRRLSRERHQQRHESFYRTSKSLDTNLAERRSLERRMRDKNEQHIRSLSAEFRMIDQMQNERNQNRHGRLTTRDTERIVKQIQPSQYQVNEMRIPANLILDENNRETRLSTRQVSRNMLNNERLPVDVSRMFDRNERQSRLTRKDTRFLRQEVARNDERRSSTVRRAFNVRLSDNTIDIMRNNERLSEIFTNDLNDRFHRHEYRIRTETGRVRLDANEQFVRDMRYVERNSRLANREETERTSRTRKGFRNYDRRSSMIIRDGNERLANLQETRRGERHSDVAYRTPSKDSREGTRFTRLGNNDRRTIVLNRQESDRSFSSRRDSSNDEYSRPANHGETLSRSRREIRNDDRLTERREDSRRVQLQSSMDRQTIRSVSDQDHRSHSEVRHSLSRGNLRITALSPSVEIVRERDTTRRIKVVIDRESAYQPRNIEIARNKQISASRYTMKTHSESSTFTMNWQTVLYTLQGIYLCGFIMQMMSHNEPNKGKARGLSWFLPSDLIKVD